MVGVPPSVQELEELLAAGFQVSEVDSAEETVLVTLRRGRDRETLTLGPDAAARLLASGIHRASGRDEASASLASTVTLEGLLKDGFSITAVTSKGGHVAVTLRDGEHRETLALPAEEVLELTGLASQAGPPVAGEEGRNRQSNGSPHLDPNK